MGHRARRWPTDRCVTIATSGGPIKAKVLDVSTGGLKLMIPRPADFHGNRVELWLDNDRITGDVRWRKDGFLGIEFSSIPPDRVLSALANGAPVVPRQKNRQAAFRLTWEML